MDIVDYLHLQRHAIRFPVVFPSRPLSEPHPRIAMVPCSRWITKNWPAENFVEVGRQLQERIQANLYLVGAPAFIEAMEKMLSDMGVAAERQVCDPFTGMATATQMKK